MSLKIENKSSNFFYKNIVFMKGFVHNLKVFYSLLVVFFLLKQVYIFKIIDFIVKLEYRISTVLTKEASEKNKLNILSSNYW